MWASSQSFSPVPGGREDSDEPQLLVISDTPTKAAGKLALIEGVELQCPAVNVQILKPGVISLIPNTGKLVFCFII